jgi:hypothetical protein
MERATIEVNKLVQTIKVHTRPDNRFVKDQSDSCIMISKHIVQMAEDFDLDGIQKLAETLI